MASHNNGGGTGGNSEPAFAPQAGRWYNLSLGPSFKDNSTKFCTLRYEFKPASIDKSQAGNLHKNKDNRVSVEFNNNQPGKPKVAFEGSSEDYKENDGVLFFDGETFRLERLHRAVKRLRHVRVPGESTAAASSAATAAPAISSGTAIEPRSPPSGKTVKLQPFAKSAALSVPVEVEKIDLGDPDSPGTKPTTSRSIDYHSKLPSLSTYSPEKKAIEEEDNLHLIFGDDDNDEKTENQDSVARAAHGFDGNFSNRNDSEDELADVIAAVNASDDEGDKGPNAAEAIRAAEENTEDDQQPSSSSSGSSGSESRSSGSGSGSGSSSASSSSDSEASDEDTGSSAGDIDI